eukprot:jgi/Mesen1/10139/ME000076S09647
MASVSKVNHVFVYGSLMAEEVLQKLIGRVPAQSPAYVQDYHRYSIRGANYPAVAPRKDSSVTGKVLYDLSDSEQEVFDEFEDVQYVRTLVASILLEQVQVAAYMYVWANHSDPVLYGDWDYQGWRKMCLDEYVQMCHEFSQELGATHK